jgi:hypothetical protein
MCPKPWAVIRKHPSGIPLCPRYTGNNKEKVDKCENDNHKCNCGNNE